MARFPYVSGLCMPCLCHIGSAVQQLLLQALLGMILLLRIRRQVEAPFVQGLRLAVAGPMAAVVGVWASAMTGGLVSRGTAFRTNNASV